MPPLFVAHTYIDNNYVVKVKHKILKLKSIFTLSGDGGFSHLFALFKAMLLYITNKYTLVFKSFVPFPILRDQKYNLGGDMWKTSILYKLYLTGGNVLEKKPRLLIKMKTVYKRGNWQKNTYDQQSIKQTFYRPFL